MLLKISIIVVIALSLALAACERQPPPRPAAAAEQPAAEVAQAAARKELPPDGKPLFEFLLAEIPELVARVPCSCCPYKLAECYQGACPPTCGPCNEIGRQVYMWHVAGTSDEEILARVQEPHAGSGH